MRDVPFFGGRGWSQTLAVERDAAAEALYADMENDASQRFETAFGRFHRRVLTPVTNGLRTAYTVLFTPGERAHTHALPETFESVDYNPPNSVIYRNWLNQQPYKRTWDRWLIMAVIGATVAMVAFLLEQTIDVLFNIREEIGRYLLQHSHSAMAWFAYVLLSGAAALAASWLVVNVAPGATASGIPQIMAFLNGVNVPGVLRMPTFIVKFASCSLAVAAGLPIGQEGPMVHMGAIIGSAVSSLHSVTLGFDLGLFKHLRGNNHKRDFVTAGVAAGITSAFHAPIGGLLFAMEEVSSFWHMELSMQILLCDAVALFVQKLLQSGLAAMTGQGWFGFFNYSVLFEEGIRVYDHVLSIFPAAVLGLVCGVLAAAFTYVNVKIIKLRKRTIDTWKDRRMLEVLIVTIIYVGVSMLLPHFFECQATHCTVPVARPRTPPNCAPVIPGANSTSTASFTNEDLAMEKDPFTCPNTINPANASEYLVSYNSMATLVTPLGEDTISRMFARSGYRDIGYTPLIVMFVWYTAGAAWCAGMSISSGLFVPMLLIGSIVGRVLGLVAVDLTHVADTYEFLGSRDQWKWIDPGVFAVIGAAAFLAGVTRISISVPVIMMEVSSDVQMLLPILVASIVGKSVADWIHPHSYYHAMMEHSGMMFLRPKPEATAVNLDILPVHLVMSSPVTCVLVKSSLNQLQSILNSNIHNGFPVVRKCSVGHVCLGLITRQHLEVILKRALEKGSLHALRIEYPHLNTQVEAPLQLAQAAEQVRQLELSESPRTLRLNGSPTNGAQQYMPQAIYSGINDEDDTHPLMAHTARSNQAGASTSPGGRDVFFMDETLDLTRYMDTSTMMVHDNFSLARAYDAFTNMGLRHLIIVNEVNLVRGIVTRKDLLPAKLKAAATRGVSTLMSASTSSSSLNLNAA